MRVEIDLLPEKTLEITSGTQSSLSTIAEISDMDKIGFRGFHFTNGDKNTNSGCWLDGSFKFYDSVKKYPGWMGNALSKEDGTFDVPQIINISTSNIENLIIKFDAIAGEYATEIVIDGNILVNNYDYYCILPGGATTIEFRKWSRANSLAKVLAIKSGITLKYTTKNLIGVEYSNKVTSSENLLNFGITLQNGELSVLDDGILVNLNEQNLLLSGAVVRMYDNSNIKIQEFIVEDYSSLDPIGNTWRITLTDDLKYFDNEQFAGLTYKSRNVKEMLDLVIPEATYLTDVSKIVIPVSYVDPCTKWAYINQLCSIGLLYIYKINGTIYVRGIV